MLIKKNFILKLVFLAALILPVIYLQKFALKPPPALAQQPPLEDCGPTGGPCLDGSQPHNFCWAGTSPACQFGCRADFTCRTSGGCTSDAYCQALAGSVIPGHPCAGSCDQQTG